MITNLCAFLCLCILFHLMGLGGGQANDDVDPLKYNLNFIFYNKDDKILKCILINLLINKDNFINLNYVFS